MGDLGTELAFDGARLESGCAHRHRISCEALCGDLGGQRAGEDADIAISRVKQALGCRARSVDIVGEYGISTRVADGAIECDHRDALVQEAGRTGTVRVGRGNDDAKDSLFLQCLKVSLLLCGALISVADQDAVALCECGVLNGADCRAEVSVPDVGHDDADHRASLFAEAACQGVGAVVQFGYGV
jgi:hypothetical protein